MGKGSGSTRTYIPQSSSAAERTDEQYHKESVRLRREALNLAEPLTGNPKTFTVEGISGVFELSKTDVKTIVSKNTRDEKFNAIKNALAKDVEGYLKKANYFGWREVEPGKHPETEYFEYYDRSLGVKTYICVRVMKGTGKKKPYAIIDENTLKSEIDKIHKEKR